MTETQLLATTSGFMGVVAVKEAAHVLRIVLQARQNGIAVIFITHNVVHALTVGDHFVVLIRGSKAAEP
jgi:simple sugar transport system ATP-binding protein